MDLGSEVWKFVEWDTAPLLSLMPLSYKESFTKGYAKHDFTNENLNVTG
jgi:hypothetical protein